MDSGSGGALRTVSTGGAVSASGSLGASRSLRPRCTAAHLNEHRVVALAVVVAGEGLVCQAGAEHDQANGDDHL